MTTLTAACPKPNNDMVRPHLLHALARHVSAAGSCPRCRCATTAARRPLRNREAGEGHDSAQGSHSTYFPAMAAQSEQSDRHDTAVACSPSIPAGDSSSDSNGSSLTSSQMAQAKRHRGQSSRTQQRSVIGRSRNRDCAPRGEAARPGRWSAPSWSAPAGASPAAPSARTLAARCPPSPAAPAWRLCVGTRTGGEFEW